MVLCRYHLLQSKGSSIQLVCSSRWEGTRYLQDMLLWRYLELKLYQFSPRVSSGSDFLGNTPRPEHFGIPQRIATRHPKKHLPLHPPFPTSASAFSNHVGPSECAVLRQEEDWYGRIPVARSRIGCEVINYEPVLTGCSYRSRPLQERQRPDQGQRQTPLSYATRDPPFQGERNATGSYRM